MLRLPLLFLGLLCLSAPARSQPVTFADIQGSVINVTAVHQEKIIRNEQVMNIELQTTGQVMVGSGKKITSQFQSTSTNQSNGRSRSGPTVSGSTALDAPGKGVQGYDVLWTFTNGSLVRLRVFSGGQGGQKMTIRFRRTAGGLSCTFAMPMAREVGVGRIAKGSAIDNVPVEILEFRQTGSSCQVAKG